MEYVWGRIDIHTGIQWGNLFESYHSEDLSIERRVFGGLVLGLSRCNSDKFWTLVKM